MAALGCLLVYTFGDYLGGTFVAVYTVNNLEHDDELENEGYESKGPENLTLAWIQRYKIKWITLSKNIFRRVMLKYVPLNRLVSIEPRYLKLIPDDLKTQ